MRRRNFLIVAAAVIPTVLAARAAPLVLIRGGATIDRNGLHALAPYLDTLLPAGDSPAATELDIHHYLVEHAAGVRNYLELLSLGCRWLDAQAAGAKTFVRLDSTAQERIVARLEGAASGTIEHQFFERSLSDTMQFYYAHPRTWPALGFTGPPQPVGFPDYRVAPA